MIGQRIQGMLPLSASVYRLDGDEFGITVSGERFEMMELYRSLSESFRSQQEYDGKKYFCTISAGSASYPEDASGYTELSEYASHSLKYAKKLGRNRIVFFSRAILEQEMRSLELVELLRESIERQFEGFELVYQPQIAVDTRHVVGAEALAAGRARSTAGVPRRVYPPVGAERAHHPLRQVGIPGGRSTVQGMDEKPP